MVTSTQSAYNSCESVAAVYNPPTPPYMLYISYCQIKALLMLEPSVVTPKNQYFPDNDERMDNM